MTESEQTKLCAHCGERRPLAEFKRRSGKRRGATGRRGACRSCREEMRIDEPEAVERAVPAELEEEAAMVAEPTDAASDAAPDETPAKKKRRRRRRRSKAGKGDSVIGLTAAEEPEEDSEDDDAEEPRADEIAVISAEGEPPAKKKKRRRRRSKKNKVAATGGEASTDTAAAKEVVPAADVAAEKTFVYTVSPRAMREIGLKPTWGGFIRMRGKTDNGRKWYQEIDPDLAYTLVTENAAVVVNRHTIRRIYSNKEFRKLILERDRYTCYFCKEYGDTIDHLLPRAKGGHTTPDNCVCACNLCNQSKADKDLEVFMNDRDFG